MRLSRFALTCYGHFEKKELELAPRFGCVNLVVAPNGAGKSVLRQAIGEMLFGIHPQTPMGFSFPYAKMRLLVEAEHAGTQFGFVRRKGDLNTVTDLDGRPADAALLGRLPRRDERKRLERLFILDSGQLRAGGKALMQSDGDLADALLSGAGELGSARALARVLAAQRDLLAPLRRQAKLPFYAACDQWSEAGRALMAAMVRPPEIAARETQRNAARQAQAAANAEVAAQSKVLDRLGRIRRTRPVLRALAVAEDWLAAHPDAPDLPGGVGPRLEAAHEAAAAATKAQAAMAAQHDALQRDLAAQGPDDPVLAEAAAVEALWLESRLAQQSQGDLPKVQGDLAASEARLAALLRDLGLTPGPDVAADVVRPAADIAAARALIQDASRVEAELATAGNAVAGLRLFITDAEEEQAALPPPAQVERARALLAEITAAGDPAARAQEAAAAAESTQVALGSALARVPYWGSGSEQLRPLVVPSEAELDRMEEASRTAATTLVAAQDAYHAGTDQIAAVRQRLEDVTGIQTLPDAAAIANARAHRDRGWRLVEARLAGRPGPEDQYDGGAPIALAYARAVAAADAVADRRAEETERLAVATELARELGFMTMAQGAKSGQLEAARRAEAQARAAWAARMVSLGLPEGATAAEARAFLHARDAVVAAAAAHEQAAAHADRLLHQHAEWAAALAEALGQPPSPLPLLVSIARSQVAQADRADARRDALATRLRTDQRRLAAAEQKLAECQAARSAWSAQWQSLLARLGRPDDELPGVTAPVLDVLLAVQMESAAAAGLAVRVSDMQAQLTGFAEHARALAGRLGLDAAEPLALASTLSVRAAAATAQRAKRQVLQDQAAAAAAQREASRIALLAAQAELAAAIAATGAAGIEDARHRVAQAAERATRRAAAAEAQRRLDEEGDGLSSEALRAEMAAVPPEALAEQIRAAQAASSAAQADAQAQAAQAERIETELQMLATRHEAVVAASNRQAAAARLSHVLEDALVQHTAAAMLDNAMHQVEAEGGTNAKLARIGAVFTTLTGGAYDRVSPAEDSVRNEERLQAHERGGAVKHIAQLSEGTRDALYLALRIVAIQDHAAGAPPLPFIADDILQTFDDTRSVAALHALLALSRHTQVIVLTHHPHLATLAGALPEGSVHLASL